ncbi:MAG TPA: isopentenyl-diphosphate Delta-isomerase [Longimicrobiaceae bacterium]|nr:isopentenyl-diphosphate Delta-isomerase [Longimicrobiaceae bacterium]
MSKEERVILVDEHDIERGSAEKLRAHVEGELHRAFSVVVFNRRGEVLLQRRAAEKYHSGGLWSNTCCGHPRPGEDTALAARRRLREEMGLDCDLEWICGFRYRAELRGGLAEHEYDHLFVGRYDGDPHPDPEEVEDWSWVPLDRVRREIADAAERYTPWFRHLLERLPTSPGE